MLSPRDKLYPTKRAVFMGCIYAIGGLVYGYDTGNEAFLLKSMFLCLESLGQISGFLQMESFKQSFGTFDPKTSTYSFPTTRSGLIVGMV